MSYNPYNQAPATEAGYNYGQPYGQQEQHEMQPYGQQQGQYGQQEYEQPQQPTAHVLSQGDFLSRVSAIRNDIQSLGVNVQNIATLHQRALTSNDGSAQRQLDDLVAQTQLKNTSIRGQIQQLKGDAERTTDGSFGLKKRQYEIINNEFKAAIQKFIQEESQYKERYREQISRQYRIINPQATEEEVRQAADADWGNEGIFQTALKSNRSGQASAVLGNVRAQHNDMEKIRRTLEELVDLFQGLETQLALQEPVVENVSQMAEQTKQDLVNANTQIDKGIDSARRRRKLKWWCLLVVVLIVIAIALGVGLGIALTKNAAPKTN
ncbi:putative snare domain-protein [Podospora aff. communis PSN243]|uniref:Snare domain-protein n=1 Tax=Podospora aff. communis PSN243 TaxID=3040156 RepID=A0AAV9H0F7_9PEZI|nr:putative snare domain-protein [Podospora aff. communis PSN243]